MRPASPDTEKRSPSSSSVKIPERNSSGYVVSASGAWRRMRQRITGRIRRLCDVHTGVGSDGVLLLSQTEERGFVARLRIFNPDGSEAELSGNGAREAVLYLRRRGWVDSDSFSIVTAAGEMRPRITGPS